MDQLHYVNRGLKPKTWYVEIASNANTEFLVRVKMPKYINNIIGIKSFAAGSSPNNTALLAPATSDEYFLQLISLSGGFILDRIRLDVITYQSSSVVGFSSADSYFPTNIRGMDVDLPRSIIRNPGGASNALMLGFLYV